MGNKLYSQTESGSAVILKMTVHAGIYGRQQVVTMNNHKGILSMLHIPDKKQVDNEKKQY